MTTPSAPARSAHETKSAIAVDPTIGAVIRNPAAPQGVPARVQPPPSLPGEVGVLALARSLYGCTRYGARHTEAMRDRYGDIYRYMWAAEPIVQLWDADEVQRMLRNEDSAWSTAMGWDTLVFDRLDTREGNLGSLLSLDFDQHRVARKVLMPAFTSKAIKGYIDIAQPRFARAVDGWLARGAVDFKRAARGLLAHVASDIFTGCDDPREVMRLEQALEDFWRGPQALSRNPRFSPAFRRAQRGFKTLHETFLALIPERRESPGADLFSHLCQVEDRGGLDDDAMVRVFVTVMLGAFDTTSLGITSMAYLLARYPEWQERLREEARALDGATLDNTSLSKLEQHEWVWKETLRLMPLSLGVPRRALREVTVSGHELPAGTMVVPMSGAMGRHPKWWSEPLKFDPLRFSSARAEDKRHSAIYLPFGAGAHACIGAQLANIEAKLLFHQLLTRCRLELAPHYEARHTLTPLGCVSGKVRLKLVARSDAS